MSDNKYSESEVREFAAYYSLMSRDEPDFTLFGHFDKWKASKTVQDSTHSSSTNKEEWISLIEYFIGIKDYQSAFDLLKEKYSKPSSPLPLKPPLGLMPMKIWREHRLEYINAAIERYKEAGKEIPQEWINEKQTIQSWLQPSLPTEKEESKVVTDNSDVPCLSLNDIYFELKMICDGTFGSIDRWNFILSSDDTPEYFYKRLEQKVKEKLKK